MNRVLDGAPWRGPNGTVTSMDLVDGVMDEIISNLKDGGPKDGARAISSSCPEGIVAEIFGIENSTQEGIRIGSNVPCSMGDKALVDIVEIPDTQTSIFLTLADIFPGAKSNWIGRVVILDPGPPEPLDDSVNFFDEILGEKDRGHVVNRDGSQDKFDVSESTSIVQFVSFNSSEFSSKFIDNEFIGFVAVSVTENHGMTQVNGIGKKVRNREDVLNLSSGMVVNFLAKENGGLVKIRNLL